MNQVLPAFDRLGNLWTQDASGQRQLFYEDFTGFGGLTAGGGGNASPFKFGGANGCQTDADTALVLMGHRYFDPRIGRFITQDPAGAGSNWYVYCHNNPINTADPSGLEPTFSVPGDWSQAQVEAYTALNYGDGTYTYSGKTTYTFTLSTPTLTLGNVGHGLNLSAGYLGQFLQGTDNANRYYGSHSNQSQQMKNTAAYQQMLGDIVNGKAHGKVDTFQAFRHSFSPFEDGGVIGTENELGAFNWSLTNPKNLSQGIDITNDSTANSFLLHGLEHGVASADPELVPNGPLPTQWWSGPMRTISQKIHLSFP